MSDLNTSIIFTAIDRVSTSVGNIERRLKGLERSVGGVTGKLGLLRGGFNRINAVLAGVGLGFGVSLFYTLERAIGRVVGIIPDLINRGKDWLSTVDAVADATGLAADKASTLAAQAQHLEVPVENVGRAFGMFTKNVGSNSQALDALGVTWKDANGNALDAYSIFRNLNAVLARTGIDTSNAAQVAKLFGRSWFDVVDLLTAPPALLDAIAAAAQRSGQIVSGEALRQRQDLVRTQLALQGAIDGMSTNIFTALAPTLTSLVNSIRVAIEQNMAQIVSFVSRVAGFVVGVVSGLFGLNLEMANFMADAPQAASGAGLFADEIEAAGEEAAGAAPKVGRLERAIKRIDAALRGIDRRERNRDSARQRRDLVKEIAELRRGGDANDAYSRSIERQIAAIDRQLAAMDRRNAAQDAERERSDILSEISDLEAQLEDMKSTAVFTAGMSAAEAELARQRAAAQVVDQEKQIADAKQRLRDHDQDQADRLHRDELSRRRDALQEQLRQHQELTASHERLADAIDRLREFDHDEQVRHQREGLEDQRRGLQDRLAAIRDAAGKAKDLWKPILNPAIGGGAGGGPLAGFATSVKTELDKALLEGRDFATNLRSFLFGGFEVGGNAAGGARGGRPVEGLLPKIGAVLEGIGQLVGGGPNSIIALILAWKVGGAIFNALVAAIAGRAVGGAVPTGAAIAGGAAAGLGAIRRAIGIIEPGAPI